MHHTSGGTLRGESSLEAGVGWQSVVQKLAHVDTLVGAVNKGIGAGWARGWRRPPPWISLLLRL